MANANVSITMEANKELPFVCHKVVGATQKILILMK
jgi:hypothetical protein